MNRRRLLLPSDPMGWGKIVTGSFTLDETTTLNDFSIEHNLQRPNYVFYIHAKNKSFNYGWTFLEGLWIVSHFAYDSTELKNGNLVRLDSVPGVDAQYLQIDPDGRSLLMTQTSVQFQSISYNFAKDAEYEWYAQEIPI